MATFLKAGVLLLNIDCRPSPCAIFEQARLLTLTRYLTYINLKYKLISAWQARLYQLTGLPLDPACCCVAVSQRNGAVPSELHGP